MSSHNNNYSLYILSCDRTTLYTGISKDPKARLEQHINGKPYGAKFTRKFDVIELVYQVVVGNRSLAQSLEYKVKKLTKANKQKIINSQFNLKKLCQFLG